MYKINHRHPGTAIVALILAVALAGCTGAQTRDNTVTGTKDPGAGSASTVAQVRESSKPVKPREDQTATELMENITASLEPEVGPDQDTLLDVARLKSLAPDSPATWLISGIARHRAGDLPGAAEDLNTTLTMDPGNEKAFLLLGDMSLAEGNFTEADSMYSKAFKLDNSESAANRLALLRIEGGYLESARDILLVTLQKSPESIVTRNNLAVVSDRMGETSEAIRLLEEASVEDHRLLRTKALLLLKEGFTQQAADDLENAFSGNEDLNLLLIAGILDLQRGKLVAAEDRFRQAVENYPDNYQGYLNLGQALRRQGRFSDAEETYVKGIEVTGHEDLHLNLGILYELYRGDAASAVGHYRTYVRMGGASSSRIQGWIDYLAAIVPPQAAQEEISP
jgi:Flp pilus assembly protein TadD